MGRTTALFLSLLAGPVAACASPELQIPRAGRAIVLPFDHGAHPEFKTEWWYFNGHLAAEDGRRVDYFLSLVRHDTRGDSWLGVPVFILPREAALGMFAIVEPARAKYDARAKTNFPDVWAAGATQVPAEVWHDDWRFRWDGDACGLAARAGARELRLRLVAEKPAALYGDRGFADVPNAPQYVYSYTRLKAEGLLDDGGHAVRVSGTSWFDHFIGDARTSAYRGWHWMSLQLDDGYDYMIGELFDANDARTPYANLVVAPDGAVTSLAPGSVRWTPRRSWRSPSGAKYALDWTIEAPGLRLEVAPTFDAQEFRRFPVSRFWEGSIVFFGTHDGREVRGEGFEESVAEGGFDVLGAELR